MTLRPPTLEHPLAAEGPASPEVLFREARRRRRRRWTVAALCATTLGVVAGVGISISTSTPGPRRTTSQEGGRQRAAAGPPLCRAAQLEVTGTPATGAAIYGGEILVYKSTGSRACRLSGYPNVTAATATTGTEITARHELGGYLGGLGGERASIKNPPTVILRGQGDVASSMVEWSSVGTYTEVSPRCIGAGHHAMVIDELRIVVDGGRTKILTTPAATAHGFGAVCNQFRADPYVPGSAGKWNPTFPTEYGAYGTCPQGSGLCASTPGSSERPRGA
jgi:hypothetical protein